MSQTDQQKPHSECKAFGCPCFGTHIKGTSGSQEWLCWNHLKADVSQWQSITNELRRLGWLVDASRIVRTHAGSHKLWPSGTKRASDLIRNGMRNDLLQSEDETPENWMLRLEQELTKICHESMKGFDV